MKLSIVLLTALVYGHAKGGGSDQLGETSCFDTPDVFLRLFRGVDITRFEIMPSDFTKSDGVRGFSLEYTCLNFSNTWMNPFTQKKIQIPDQFREIHAKSGSLADLSLEVLANEEDVRTFFAKQVGLEYQRGMFQDSMTMQKLVKEMISKGFVFTDVSSTVSNVFTTLEELELSYQTREWLAQLPDDFTQNPESYQDFIQTFGTHVFESGVFGPKVKNLYKTNIDRYISFGREYLEQQCKGSYMNWLQSQTDINHDIFDTDWGFDWTTTKQSFYFGGDPALVYTSNFDDWMKTAIEYPILYAGNLIPLYDLIDDELLKRSMKKAVVAHLDRAYLKELVLKLETAIDLYKINNRLGRLGSLLERVREELTATIPKHDIVEKLGDDVDFELNTPTWWHETNFCMQYRNEQRRNYCEGKSPNCARVDQSTRAFTDATRNKGGCYLSWGVFGTPAQNDTWFNEVQLCMKYVPVGDPNQCDRWGIPERCSGLNEYTEDYYDKTDGRSGGCALAWKLSIPDEDELPTWFLNSKLCHNVLRLGTSNKDPEFEKNCALINEYTPVYKDYTTGLQYNIIQWSLETGIKDYRL